MMKILTKLISVLGASSIALGSLVPSVSLASSRDVSHIESILNRPNLQGAGKFTYFGFHVYDASLYRSELPGSQDFALDIQYRKSLSGQSIATQSIQEMKKLGHSSSQLSLWERELLRIFPNIEPGETLTAVFKPKEGTIFFHNGKRIAQISSIEFSKAFFSIWLDPKTTAPSLRGKLLAQSCPPPLISEAC